MADVSTVAEGLAAYDAGADLVSTTLSGYTSDSVAMEGPDLQLVEELALRGVPTVAEGRIGSPQQARSALERGAMFVVVGRAITDPVFQTAAYVSTLMGR
jgi:N-acylglucosamine-6-phosphate 2-epimerase